jgi:hypothetical protein
VSHHATSASLELAGPFLTALGTSPFYWLAPSLTALGTSLFYWLAPSLTALALHPFHIMGLRRSLGMFRCVKYVTFSVDGIPPAHFLRLS